MDTRFTDELQVAFDMFRKAQRRAAMKLPYNEGRTPEKKRRLRDCAVLNFYFERLRERGAEYDTVRCGFLEGPPAFPGSGIRHESHIQLAVRNPTCILGVFRPMMIP
jgi:hypothetical protein